MEDRNNSHERRGTTANQFASHPPMRRSHYRQEQPLLVPQIFDNHWTNSLRPPRHPLPQILHSNNDNHVQHYHYHPVNNRGIPTIPFQNRNRPRSGYQGVISTRNASRFHHRNGQQGGDRLDEVANYRQYERQVRGYDHNNSGDNHNGVGVPPRRPRHYDRRTNNNSRRPRVPSAEHDPHAPRFQDSFVEQHHRYVPRFRSSSPTQRNHLFPSATSVEIVDEQLVIRLVFPFPADINYQERPLPESLFIAEQTNHVSTTGLSEDSILTHLKTRTLVGKPTSKDEMCTICQDEIEGNSRIGTLACGHEYHADCITNWLKINNLCPLCKRTGLTLDNRPD